MSEGDLKITSEGQLSDSSSTGSTEAGGLTNFSTSKVKDISKAMRDLEPLLVPDDIEWWVKYWNATGLFNDI